MSEAAPSPANPSEVETARLRGLFQSTQEPAEIIGVDLEGRTPRQVIHELLPVYDESVNRTYGIFVDAKTGKGYGIRSGLTFEEETHGSVPFRSGLLSTVDVQNTIFPFNRLEAHVEAQVAGWMRKHNLAEGTLYLNATGPCLGPESCDTTLTHLLPPGSRLRVYGTSSAGIYLGSPD